VNHTRFPKEDHLPEWARRDNKVTKGDRVCSNKKLSTWTCISNSHTLVHFSRVIPIFTRQLPLHKSSINLAGDLTKWFGLTAPQIAHSCPSLRMLTSETTDGKSRKFNIKLLKYIDILKKITFRLQRTYGTLSYGGWGKLIFDLQMYRTFSFVFLSRLYGFCCPHTLLTTDIEDASPEMKRIDLEDDPLHVSTIDIKNTCSHTVTPTQSSSNAFLETVWRRPFTYHTPPTHF